MQDWWSTVFPSGRQTITIRDANDHPVSIAYGERGVGKPLILVHGIASWSYGWRDNIEPLSRHFRVICFDAKGSGFSDKPLHPDSPGHKVIELIRFIQALCDEPAIAVSQSLGALITLAAAQAAPELFERLVIMAVPLFLDRLPNWGMQLLADLPLDIVRWVDEQRILKTIAPALRHVIYSWRGEVVANPSNVTYENVYWTTYPYIESPGTLTRLAEELRMAAQEIRQLASGKPNLIRDVQQHLHQITHPTLILWGDCDRWFPISHGQQLHRHLPHAQFRLIPNCGHYVTGDQPELVTQWIVEFLSDLSPS